MMMPKHAAAAFLRGITNDYYQQLKRNGHTQAAELIKANGHAAIESLAAESRKVPDADNPG